MKIIALSRSEAKQFVYERPWVAISIDSFEGEHPKINAVQRVALLQLSYGDIDHDMGPNHGKLFDKDDANKVWDFLEQYWDKIELVMVHCMAGVSRSAATAAAIDQCMNGGNGNDFYGGRYHPNNHVLRTLRDTYYERQANDEVQS